MAVLRGGRWKAALAVGLAAAMWAGATTASAQASLCSPDATLLSGAVVRICMPGLVPWNRDLVVFAHGYVAPGAPVAIPEDQLRLDETSIPEVVNGLGFAFATTSYSDDGLVVLDPHHPLPTAVEDLEDLVDKFKEALAPSDSKLEHVYVVGASEGGLVTTLAVEQSDAFSGGLATCGPVGDFRRQIDYLGDFRVLFDYFFPEVIPGDAVNVPDISEAKWLGDYAPDIEAALRARPGRLDTLLRVSRASFDPNDPRSKIDTALGILRYGLLATNDAQKKLDGNPYDNSRRLYLGSGNDFWLNLLVDRFHADTGALDAMEAYYQTSGTLGSPLVTLHTTADPIVPYWHEPLYSAKLLVNSGLLHTNLPVFRYGHCSFKAEEALVGLGLLVLKVEGRELLNAERVLPTKQARLRYRALAKTNGLRR